MDLGSILFMLLQQSGSTAGAAQVYSNGLLSNAVSVLDWTTGFMADGLGSQSFAFSNNSLGSTFSAGGQLYSLRPDFVSQSLFGQSWTVLQNGFTNVGSIWSNNVTPSFGWTGLSAKLGSGMVSTLTSSGAW